MKLYGLIGYPLSHSFSPAYFSKKFSTEHINAEYLLFPIKSIKQFTELLTATPHLAGLNVTSPHKETVIAFLDEVSAAVQEIGAVNTIVFKDDKRIGHNTDAPAFEQTLLSQNLKSPKALIFGTGGASKAVQFVLKKHKIPFTLVSRKASEKTISYADLTTLEAEKANLWINCTPVGTFPNITDKLDLPYSSLTQKHTVIDLVYNPEQTAFMLNAQKFGAKTVNGVEMLHNQAQKAWELWQA